ETEQRIAAYLTNHLRLFSDSEPCELVHPGLHLVPSEDSTRRIWTWPLVCSSSRLLQLHVDAFFAAAPAHLHFARVHIAGAPISEKVFSVHSREWLLFDSEVAGQRPGSRFRDYLWLGITHILSGVDHLAFLVALLLMAESLAQVAQIVTGFTVAHS